MKTTNGQVINRRIFFEIAGAGIAGYFLSPMDLGAQVATTTQYPAVLMNTAKNVVFILLQGAASHVDTFDLKVGSWTPASFAPTSLNGVDFPSGLLPTLTSQFDKIALLRSCQSNALVHSLLQQWNQIARNPASSSAGIAPNVGAVVALEADAFRQPGQILPGFVSLNTGGNIQRNGYFPARYAPFDVTANANGLANLQHPDGTTSFNERFQVLQTFNQANPLRADFDQMRDFYVGAASMMNDPTVNNVFRFSATDQTRYGNTGFGSSCIVVRNLIGADMGTRYYQINLGGWDNHSNIYLANGGIFGPARQLDLGLGNLIADLAGMPGANGRTRLDETLIVVKGEFGRTVGNLNNQGGGVIITLSTRRCSQAEALSAAEPSVVRHRMDGLSIGRDGRRIESWALKTSQQRCTQLWASITRPNVETIPWDAVSNTFPRQAAGRPIRLWSCSSKMYALGIG